MGLFNKILGKKKQTSPETDVLPSALIEFKGEEGTKFAVSNFGSIWGSFDELDGYHFFEARIISHKNIKTFKGARLEVQTENDSWALQSAMQELESESIDGVKAYLTRISFDITPDRIKLLEEYKYLTMTLSYKKQHLVFNGPQKV